MATPAETKAAGEVIVFKLVGATADKLKAEARESKQIIICTDENYRPYVQDGKTLGGLPLAFMADVSALQKTVENQAKQIQALQAALNEMTRVANEVAGTA